MTLAGASAVRSWAAVFAKLSELTPSLEGYGRGVVDFRSSKNAKVLFTAPRPASIQPNQLPELAMPRPANSKTRAQTMRNRAWLLVISTLWRDGTGPVSGLSHQSSSLG